MPKPLELASMRRVPLACFDTLKHIDSIVAPEYLTTAQRNDFGMAKSFLQAYPGSLGTFNSYRRDVERLLHWTWHIAGEILEELKREDIEAFVRNYRRPGSAPRKHPDSRLSMALVSRTLNGDRLWPQCPNRPFRKVNYRIRQAMPPPMVPLKSC